MKTSGPYPAVDPDFTPLQARRNGFGLRWSVLLTLAILVVGTVLLIGLAVLRINQNNLEEQKVREGVALVSVLAQSVLTTVDIEAPLGSAENRAKLQRLAAMHHAVQGVDQVIVFDARLEVLATNPPERGDTLSPGVEVASVVGSARPYHTFVHGETGRELLVVGPVATRGAAPVGAVGIRLPLREVDAKIAASQNLLVLYMVVDALVVLFIGYFLMTRLVVRPIVEIGRGTHRVSLGDYSKPVRRGGAGEIGQLAADFNTMLRQLRGQRERLEGQVTRLEHANEEIAAAQQSLIRSEKLATVGRLGAGMAHEVGNPLAAVIGYIELLREGDLDAEEHVDLLARVERELHRIDRILRDLLDYARADRDQTLTSVNLGPLVEGSVHLVKAQPRSRQVRFHLEVDGVPLVKAHEGRTHQVVVNLLLNAVDALEGEGDVYIRAVRQGDTVALSVRDTGPGIPADVMAHIFEPFFTTKEPGTGTGLGLAICQSIISGQGGSLSAANTADGGAEFTIRLPTAV